MTNLKKIRKSRKITQEDVAKKLGITQQAVGVIERRGVITLTSARRYAKVLKCSPLDLMDV